MYDKERVAKIIGDIERYFSDLESMRISSEKDLEDKKNFYSTSMLLFSIINRAIDLGEEVITARKLGTPSTYKDIFFMLMKNKLINAKMKDELSELSHYRNLLSHEYQNFSERDVFDAFLLVHVVKDFVKRVKADINAPK